MLRTCLGVFFANAGTFNCCYCSPFLSLSWVCDVICVWVCVCTAYCCSRLHVSWTHYMGLYNLSSLFMEKTDSSPLSSSSRRGGALSHFFHPHWHIDCCHYARPCLGNHTVEIPSVPLHVMSRRPYFAVGVLVLWLLQSFGLFFLGFFRALAYIGASDGVEHLWSLILSILRLFLSLISINLCRVQTVILTYFDWYSLIAHTLFSY